MQSRTHLTFARASGDFRAVMSGRRAIFPSVGIQHYVSQFLTRSWERPKTKTLLYYDFDVDRIEEAKAKDLFATPDVHPKEVDNRIHELIEDPLARLWHRVRREGVKPVTDWREIRAAHLLFLSQPLRVIDHAQPSGERRLDELLSMDEAQLDAMVHIHMQGTDLRLFTTIEGPPLPNSSESTMATLFYPQTGLFGFPVLEDPEKKPLGTMTGGFGVPLHPNVLLTCLPKGAHEGWGAMVREGFQAYSVGLSDACRKVVVPASVLERYDPGELAAKMRMFRAFAKEILDNATRMKALIHRMHQIAGLAP